MKLLQYDDPRKFLEHARQFLEAREAENNLILGVSSWLAAHPERVERTPYFAIVEDNGRSRSDVDISLQTCSNSRGDRDSGKDRT